MGCAAKSSTNSATDEGDSSVSADAASCSAASITFMLQKVPADPNGFCMSRSCDSAGTSWVNVSAVDGRVFPLSTTCVPRCSDCQPVSCPSICLAPIQLGDANVKLTWDGSYTVSETCGAGLTCEGTACVPQGSYVATMCAYRDLAGTTPACNSVASTPTCVTVPFTWPPPAGGLEVTGTLDADAGVD